MKLILLRAIDSYQRGREGRPSPCRFFPSCSEYAKDAVNEHGAARGSWLAVRRLMRCRPFGPSGFDPVPERVSRAHDHASCSSPSSSHTSTSHSMRRAS